MEEVLKKWDLSFFAYIVFSKEWGVVELGRGCNVFARTSFSDTREDERITMDRIGNKLRLKARYSA